MKRVFSSLSLLLLISTAHSQDATPPSPPVSSPPQPDLSAVSTGENSPVLSLSEALRLAHQNAPTLEAARARVEAAQARLQVAQARPNPTLALALPFETTGTRGATGGFDEGVFASQTIEGQGKRSARSQSAQGERNAALYDLAGTGTTLDFTVKSSYYDALRAQGERDVARATFDNAQEFLKATTEQEKEGDVPRRDVLRAQTEADRANSILVQSESDLQTRLQTLASVIGLPSGTVPSLSDKLVFVPAQFDADALTQFALERRGDVQSARAMLDARTADVRGAKAARRPDFFAEARVAQIAPQSNDVRGSSVRFGVTLPVFDYGSLKGGIAAANANAKEQQANLAEAQRVARLEVQTALRTLEAARRNVELFQNGRLQRAQTLLDLARTGYAEGASSLLDVLDARNVFRSEQADYARALAAYDTALADVERSVGGSLPPNTANSSTVPTDQPTRLTPPASSVTGAPTP